MLNKETKENLIKQFGKSEGDTGSCEVQVAILSKRIRQVTEHLKSFPKDFHSRHGLIKMVGQRRSFLRYLKNRDMQNHDSLVSSLKDQGLI